MLKRPSLLTVLGARGGASRISELVKAGIERADIAAALAAGLVDKPRRGVVALPGMDPHRIALLAGDCLLDCVSAAADHGLWVLREPDVPHVWSARGRFPDGVRGHRAALRVPPSSSRRVSVHDAVLHALRCLPPLEALVVAESAVALGKVPRPWLEAQLPGKRNGRARGIVERITPASGSPLETVAREVLLAAGFRVEVQASVAGVGYVDLLVEGRVIVELDGFAFHALDRAAFRNDRRRNNAAMASGLPTLRFTYEDVLDDPAGLVAAVLACLRAAR
ncbi:endonuclease domain-containing protein [Zafaria sp. J156]|uniref:endonuclease domain-containing protein n=1 Tax=Zafaria sp. J156 TaxID=3116490 RepID=UPI002E7A77E4|nr:DUF559 domain-containing protein [Zafaria sp. J156]MEE1621249.1 DUF559 domain-containing protein [Zafaria sp. J156]